MRQAAVSEQPGRRPRGHELRLGAALCARGRLSPERRDAALALRRGCRVRLGDILVARGWIGPGALAEALAEQAGLPLADLAARPPDPALAGLLAPREALLLRAVPWRRGEDGRARVVLADPALRPAVEAALARRGHAAGFALAPAAMVEAAQAALYRAALRRRAETRRPAGQSCRGLPAGGARAGVLVLTGLAVSALVAPGLLFALLLCLALAALCASTAFRLVGMSARLADLRRPAGPAAPPAIPAGLPVVSILVPLYREARILPRLLTRLAALDYPPELLDIALVLEEDDSETRAALAGWALPPWLRLRVVPGAALRTKPRALNFALDFCRGTIVGVYDAEDAPAPGQIRQVVARFMARGPDLACVQGVLDIYNPRQSWLTRCFTMEYAAWFRLILPGAERLGLPVPLGGTTMFVRRDVLDRLGGWDAHNVTEDADLGMRIARAGLRTEFIPTVTHEEAAARPWPWVRQRSRWLKGFALTWASHMRAPARLRADLGWRGFLTLQALFLATVAGFALAPVLWLFWGAWLLGVVPAGGLLPEALLPLLAGLFLFAEASVLLAALVATSGRAHRHLWPWIPALPLYFPLATLAAWKALWELARQPFHWDKTEHGAAPVPAATEASAAPRHLARVEP